jgi:hypothetical protein
MFSVPNTVWASGFWICLLARTFHSVSFRPYFSASCCWRIQVQTNLCALSDPVMHNWWFLQCVGCFLDIDANITQNCHWQQFVVEVKAVAFTLREHWCWWNCSMFWLQLLGCHFMECHVVCLMKHLIYSIVYIYYIIFFCMWIDLVCWLECYISKVCLLYIVILTREGNISWARSGYFCLYQIYFDFYMYFSL